MSDRAPTTAIAAALAWAEAHEAEALDGFQALLRIPSVSHEDEHRADMVRCADWLLEQLRAIGFQHGQLLPTPAPNAPMVYADWLAAGEDAPTVLIYAHYDVMPAGAPELWHSPAFEPAIRDGQLYARGAVDDKCGVWVTFTALQALLAANGRLPLNVKVIFEGDEERGSPGIAAFVAEHLDLLRADLLVISDGGGTPEQPLIMAGVRGTVDAEVIVRGPRADLHSGAYGGIVYNPIHLVGKIVAALHDDEGRIGIPGFYARVRPPTASEHAIITQSEPLLLQRGREETGVSLSWGESLGSVGLRATMLPTCDINGVWGGYQGPGCKTIIPAEAGFKVSMRVVPEQQPQEVMQLFTNFVESFANETAQVEVIPGAANWHATLPSDGPVIDALQAAYQAAWGQPARLYRAGGCVPLIGVMQQALGIPITELGFGVGGNGHAPNEYFELDYFRRGIHTAIHFYHRLAAIPRAAILSRGN